MEMTQDTADAYSYDNNKKEPVDLSSHVNRNPSTQHMLKMLAPNINLKDEYYDVAWESFQLGLWMVNTVPDSPELTAGLRKLLEAKDCFVRALVDKNPVNYTDR